MSTRIAWADETLNPLLAYTPDGVRGWHCERVSQGCTNCYAERQNVIQARGGTGLPYSRSSRDKISVRLDEKTLLKPSHWTRRPRQRIFWNSMTDLFGEWIPDEFVDWHIVAAWLAPRHTHMWLTKRPERMWAYMNGLETAERCRQLLKANAVRLIALGHKPSRVEETLWPPSNLWGLTSIEDQDTADERVRLLLGTPLAMRGVSLEPQLGPVDLTDFQPFTSVKYKGTYKAARGVLGGHLGWVIQGGESGAEARPFDIQWARDVRDQCAEAKVPYFLKQGGARPIEMGEPTGEFRTGPNGKRQFQVAADILQLKSRSGADESEWPADLQRCRAWPKVPA